MASCASYNEITLEVLDIPQYNIPTRLDSVAVIYSPVKAFVDTGGGDVKGSYGEEFTTIFLSSLEAVYAYSPRFNFVAPKMYKDTSIGRMSSGQLLKRLQYVSDTMGVSGIIVMPTIKLYSGAPSFDSFVRNGEGLIWSEALLVSVGYVKVYDCLNSKVIKEQALVDTLIFEEEGANRKEIISLMPSWRERLKIGAETLGEQMAFQHTPVWVEVKRIYYKVGSSAMRKAASLAQKSQWEEAAKIWKTQCLNTDSYISSKAYFNMAIYHEIKENFDIALKMAIKSYKKINDPYTRRYIEILSKRKRDKSRLLNGF